MQKQSHLLQLMQNLENDILHLNRKAQQTLKDLHQVQERVQQDDLTRLLRRSCFFERLDALLSHAQLQNQHIQILMIDIDHFKNINDQWGHQMGDLVLETVSKIITSSIRRFDIAGRYGGEEFIIALKSSPANAVRVAERIRKKIETHPWPHLLTPTISMGMATTGNGEKPNYERLSLIRRADEALYFAKRNGKNQLRIAG